MNKVIWIINQYASHLETRHWELAKSFVSQGYKVVVITSSFHHGKKVYLYDEPVKIKTLENWIVYVYLHANPQYNSNGRSRVLNMLDFCFRFRRARNQLERIFGQPSCIIASSAPPFVWESGYYAARHFQARFVAEFRDIWPQSIVDLQGISKMNPFVRLLSIIEKRAYQRADAIVSTMPYAWKHVCSVTTVPQEKVFWMPNGINVEEAESDYSCDLKLPKELERFLNDHWCCVYVGSIVKSEHLEDILKAFSLIKDEGIWFAIVGNGNEKEEMERLASELDISRLQFFDAIDRHLIPKMLQQSKAAVAASNDLPITQFGFSKYKLIDYLFSGTPTVFACNVKSVVQEAGHYTVPCGDARGMADAIEQIKSLTREERNKLYNSGRELIRAEYDYSIIGRRYIEMIENLQ